MDGDFDFDLWSIVVFLYIVLFAGHFTTLVPHNHLVKLLPYTIVAFEVHVPSSKNAYTVRSHMARW